MTCTAMASAVFLAACGGGGSDSTSSPTPSTPTTPPSLISPEEEVLRLFSDTSGDIADVLAAGGVAIVAREVSEATWREDFPGAGAYQLVDGEFSLEADGNDLLVTIGQEGGPTYTFRFVDAASNNSNQLTFENQATGEFFDLFIGGGGTIADLFNSNIGSGYARRVGVFYTRGDVDNFGFETRSVIGTETRDSVVQTKTGTASYQGFASINIRQSDLGFFGFNGNLSGDLDMAADFGAGKVSGTMSNLFLELRTGQTVDETRNPAGTIQLEEAAIQANAFTGGMSPDAVLTANDSAVATFADSGTYSGAFYGPNAEEIGGTMSFDADVNGNRFLGIGHFQAD
jgi:hypothetical protein